MPRLTTAEKNAISSPVDTNLMLFDTTLNAFQRYNGSAWVNVVNSDTIYTADDNLAGNRTINLNNKVLKFETSTSGGGIGIGNSAAGALTTTMTILPTSAHTRVLNILKSNTDGLACFQPDGIIFNSPSNSKIGTEDISLQGDTLISEKLTLSATDHGILLNRVTDSQMAGITATDDEIVFNTDKNALYRWNGSNWVALAAGFGIVGTTDSAGSPTFYATVKAAYDAGQGSIKLYSDITETTSRVIQMINGRDIDLNGFTYTYSATDGSNMFETLNQNCTFRIINGRLLRTGGLNTSTLLKLDKTQTQIDIINVYAENTNGKCLNTKATIFNAYGSSFIGTTGITFTTPAKVSGGTYIALNGAIHNANCTHLQNAVFRVDGSGRTITTGATVNNCEFHGEANTALNSSGTVINSYIKSTTGTALSVGINCTIIGCTVISSGSRAATASQPGSRIIKSTLITSSANSCVNNVEFVEDCNIIMNGTGGGITTSGRVVKAINNIIKINAGSGDGIFFSTLTNSQAIGNVIYLNDPTSVGVTSNNTNVYISKNTVKGSTILSDLGTGTNLFTATTDAQGNSAQL
jgi:hypothetical protein